jgi:hypothetical protein
MPCICYGSAWVGSLAYIVTHTHRIKPKSFFCDPSNNSVKKVFVEKCWLWAELQITRDGLFVFTRDPLDLLSYAKESFETQIASEDGNVVLSLYIIRHERPDSVIALRKFLSQNMQWKTFEELMQYITYEWVHQFDTSDLHNPLEEKQQTKVLDDLNAFLERFILEHSDGCQADQFMVATIGTHFELPDQPNIWKIAEKRKAA